MVQSFLPRRSIKSLSTPQNESRLGLEIALPLTLLAFILLAELSPMLKMHIDRIVAWLCDHDLAAGAIEILIACIPLWMLAVIIYEKLNAGSSK